MRTQDLRLLLRASTAAVGLGALSLSALAGGSSEQSVLIIDPTDPDSLVVGHHYAIARNIPSSNIVYMKAGAANFTAFGSVLDAFLGELAARGVETSTDCIIIAPTAQYRVSAPGLLSDQCFPVSNFSLTACYNLAFMRPEVLTGTLDSEHINSYYTGAFSAISLDSQTAYQNGVPSTGGLARRYFAAGMLGYTGEFGNTVEELITMIDRSVSSDGTRPVGTFYFMSTTDTARNVRAVQFPNVIAAINTGFGGTAVQQSGVLPQSVHDVMGVMTGVSNLSWASSGSTIMPGAFCDHLTSYAATFDTDGQTKVSEWIRSGASGSAGAIEEPCNYQGKFVHARIHALYRQGMSLGEAYLRSSQFVPFQGLMYGDPLTRAYAWPPNLSVSVVPAGPATGTVTIIPSATATAPSRQIAGYELFIDGSSRGTANVGGSFTVNTNELDDGWHDVRVLTWDNSLTKNTQVWAGDFVVANDGIAASLGAPSELAPELNELVSIELGATGSGLQELRLLANDRVVATRTSPGPVSLFGRNLGPGRVKLQTEAIFAGNLRSRSEPVELNISGEGTPPAPGAPTAFDYRKRMLRTRGAAVELPAAFADALNQATYTLITPASNATVSIAGATAMVIPGANVTGNDSFQFRVTTPSGQSNIATVTLWYECAADFDGNGSATVPDIFAFLSSWFAGNPAADFDNSGGAPSVPDIFAFLSAWFAGCN